MSQAYMCWKCGESLADILLPLPRQAECPHCHAQLHVCRMCEFYDPSVGQMCREPVAEAVSDKQRANFCGYFKINPSAYSPSSDQSEESRRQLEALFGGEPSSAKQESSNPTDEARQKLEDLFKK